MEVTINAGQLQRELQTLAEQGKHGETGVWRPVYSPEWQAAQRYIVGWCEAAGLEAHMDAAGNVWGRLEGTDGGKAIVSGSHIDTQLPGGRYDGALGVLAALNAVRALAQQFGRPKRTLEVVSLAEEESSRFPGSGFLGSSAILGTLTPEDTEQMIGYGGETLAEAMREAGLDPLALPRAARDDIGTFIELHIEQGPILEGAGVPVGIVTAINGIRHYVVELTGRSDHAGARPMDTRLDPLAGAAEIALGVIDTALRLGRPAVTTVGRMVVEPNGPAIVPEKVTFTIDARHSDPATREQLYRAHESWVEAVAARRGLGVTWHVSNDIPPLVISPRIVGVLEESARAQGIPALAMPSGAVHDTQNMARIAEAGMVFVRSEGGRSHTPAEYTTLEDAVAGTTVLAGALFELAYG